MKTYKGLRYFSKLISAQIGLDNYENSYIYPIETNKVQGIEGINLLESLLKLELIVHLDIEISRDGTDTVFIDIPDDIEKLKSIIEIVFKYKPDEINFNSDKTVLRIWWD